MEPGDSKMSGNASALSLARMKSILSNMLGRELRTEEINEITTAPARFENLILKVKSLDDEVNSLKKRKAELDQLIESSRQGKGKGWWEVNVDELTTVEEVQAVCKRAEEMQKRLVAHMDNLILKSSVKKET